MSIISQLEVFSKFKDKIPNALRSNIFKNKFECDGCNVAYIIKTSIHFITRIKEHISISFLTDLKLTYFTFSAIRNNILEILSNPLLNILINELCTIKIK